MKQLSLLAVMLLSIVGFCPAQIDLGTNNVRYLTAPNGFGGGSFTTPEFSSDGKKVVIGGRDGLLHLFDVESGEHLWVSDSSGEIEPAFTWSPDGKMIVSAGRIIKKYDSTKWRKYYIILLDHINASTGKIEKTVELPPILAFYNTASIRFVEDGKYLFVLVMSSTYESLPPIIVDPNTGELVKEFPEIRMHIKVAFDELSKRVATFGLKRGEVEVFNVEDMKSINKIAVSNDTTIRSVSFVPNTDLIIVTYSLGGYTVQPRFYLIDINTGEKKVTFAGMKGGMLGGIVTSDGKYVVTPGVQAKFNIWDVYTGELLRVWQSRKLVAAFSVSPDQRYIAAVDGGTDSLYLWPMPEMSNSGITGEKDIQEGGIVCYPNPAGSAVTVSWKTVSKSVLQVSIVDMMGREVLAVYEGNEAVGERKVDIGELSNGHYLVVMRDGERVRTEPLLIAQ
ncbi:MAG: T9SS type A sorting domain-containing protein [Chlorobi bacterium]|nr:MAG: translocation protein TolB [Chlorobi bacterium OLB7]MBK8912365.1 T9SS type A sorting domain-containing protein [Chlorobiota bacterium]MBX7217921.1 T9SS type A sorting domain-containing protein [Candidatus Kapabacteria bacterium]